MSSLSIRTTPKGQVEVTALADVRDLEYEALGERRPPTVRSDAPTSMAEGDLAIVALYRQGIGDPVYDGALVIRWRDANGDQSSVTRER